MVELTIGEISVEVITVITKVFLWKNIDQKYQQPQLNVDHH